MEGSIDRVNFRNGSYIIGGWAFKVVNGEQTTAEFRLKSGEKLQYTRVTRGDCANGLMVGFEVALDHASIFSLISKKTIIIATAGEDSIELPIWRNLELKCKKILIEKLIEGEKEELLQSHITEYIDKKIGTKDNPNELTTTLTASVGAKSIDDNVIIGKNGILFLHKGNNNIYTQYIEEPSAEAAKNWISLIEERHKKSSEVGLEFLQLIVPEKQSVHTEEYPLEIPNKTPLFEKISSALKSQSYYIDPTEELRRISGNSTSAFKRIDSHFSINGAIRTLEIILSALGYAIQTNPTATIKKTIRGDLGEKLFNGGGLREEIKIPLYNYINGAPESISEIKSIDVSGHIGTERSWRNERPLINKSVTVFGNSFFERGKDPLGLSFWFARIFRETHFYWTPEFDEEIATKNSSDIVICQTIERFLKFLPNK